MKQLNIKTTALIGLLMCCITLAACQGSLSNEEGMETQPTSPALQPVEETEQPEIPEGESQIFVEMAKAELAQLLNISSEQITVENVTPLDENNTTFTITLRTDAGEIYEYHSLDNSVIRVSEPLPTAPVEEETVEPDTPSPGEVTITETAIITPSQITFSLDELATVTITETVPAAEVTADTPFWGIYPEHVQFTFDDYVVPHALQPARLLIYPVSHYETINETAAEQIEHLRTLLAERPETISETVPFLPLANANQFMWTRATYLNFQNGSGIRYLTQFAQAVVPVNNQELFYTFQGLTDDEMYYVTAVFPINHPDLPLNAGEVPPDFSESFDNYLANIIEQLDTADAAAFMPDLTLLDAFVQSLNIASSNNLITDTASLLTELQAAEATISETAAVEEHSFFPIQAQVWQVNDAEVQVFEFADAQQQRAAAALIRDNGHVINNTAVDWANTPHFWAVGQLIVLYLGEDATIVNLLTDALGTPLTSQVPVSADSLPSAASAALDLFTKETNIAPNALEIISVTQMEWPDGCLGLAEAGEACTLAIVSGWQIIAHAQDNEYEIRANEAGTIIRWQFLPESAPYP